jgi:hypothetical protein
MDPDNHESELAREVFRDFALACRAERDRIAVARLAKEDLRFETSLADRTAAEFLAAHAIAAAKR